MSTWKLCAFIATFILVLATTAILVGSSRITTTSDPAEKSATPVLHEFTLDNGVRIVLLRVADVKRVAVVAMYEVGFVDEPAGMTQVAHLAEHLRCMSATASFAAGESFKKLNELGTANAETLPTFTYYDYTCTPEELSYVMKVEAERLSSLRITPDVIAQETPRIYAEADAVESNALAGMGKHAVMALCQSWFHQRAEALVRGGFDGFIAQQVAEFLTREYRPDQLTLGICGDFELARAESLVRAQFENIAKTPSTQTPPANWESLPKSAEIRWDTRVSAVCIAFPPPTDAEECRIASVAGAFLTQQLMTDAELMKLSTAVVGSNPLCPVGLLPFFIYATAKPGTDLTDLDRVMRSRIAAARANLASPQAKIGLQMLLITPAITSLTQAAVEQQAKMLAPRFNGRLDIAAGIVMGNCLLHSLRSRDQDASMRPPLSKMSDDEFRKLIERLMPDEEIRVTRLTPK